MESMRYQHYESLKTVSLSLEEMKESHLVHPGPQANNVT